LQDEHDEQHERVKASKSGSGAWAPSMQLRL